jgi:hypothetical protein
MSVNVSKKTCEEFIEHLRQHELVNGQIDANRIRDLARVFALNKYPLDSKKAQPLYHRCFMYAHILRDNIQIPDDFNEDNPYDPDGLYPDDQNIKKKLRKIEKRGEQIFLRIIERNNT